MTPAVGTRCYRCETEVVGVVAVGSDDDTVGVVGGNVEFRDGLVDVGSIACDSNPAIGVFTTSGTDSVDGILVPLVKQLVFSIGTSPPVVASMNLVEDLEDEVVAVVGEIGGHLSPQEGDEC